jgi:hypothetical protein
MLAACSASHQWQPEEALFVGFHFIRRQSKARIGLRRGKGPQC